MPARHRMPPVAWSECSEAQHRAVSDAFVGLRVAQTNLHAAQSLTASAVPKSGAVGWSERCEAQRCMASGPLVGLRVAQSNLQISQTCQRGSRKALGARGAPTNVKAPSGSLRWGLLIGAISSCAGSGCAGRRCSPAHHRPGSRGGRCAAGCRSRRRRSAGSRGYPRWPRRRPASASAQCFQGV